MQVVEAAQDFVPLVLLTADRPPELQSAGANQSINQVSIRTQSIQDVHFFRFMLSYLPSTFVLINLQSLYCVCWTVCAVFSQRLCLTFLSQS